VEGDGDVSGCGDGQAEVHVRHRGGLGAAPVAGALGAYVGDGCQGEQRQDQRDHAPLPEGDLPPPRKITRFSEARRYILGSLAPTPGSGIGIFAPARSRRMDSGSRRDRPSPD